MTFSVNTSQDDVILYFVLQIKKNKQLQQPRRKGRHKKQGWQLEVKRQPGRNANNHFLELEACLQRTRYPTMQHTSSRVSILPQNMIVLLYQDRLPCNINVLFPSRFSIFPRKNKFRLFLDQSSICCLKRNLAQIQSTTSHTIFTRPLANPGTVSNSRCVPFCLNG